MTIQTCIWIPPSLCGCQLQITGDFDSGQIHNGVSYKHPTPYTITDISIINVCATHQPNTLEMIDTSIFFDDAKPAGISDFLSSKLGLTPPPKMVQNRGYLKYPINNPTPAQCLYTFLTQYKGTLNRQPCGCSGHIFMDDQGIMTWLEHAEFSKKCDYHVDDTHDLKQAITDCKEYTAQLEK